MYYAFNLESALLCPCSSVIPAASSFDQNNYGDYMGPDSSPFGEIDPVTGMPKVKAYRMHKNGRRSNKRARKTICVIKTSQSKRSFA